MAACIGSLDEFIEKATLECLNQDETHPVANAFQPNRDLVLQSDPSVDHQMIIKVTFRQPVKLSSIRIIGNSQDETAPQTVKVFQGKNHMGFQEAEEEEPTQELTFTAADVDKGEPVPVRFVKFQSVQSLQIFVAANFGSNVTRVHRLEFLGQPAQAMDMKDFKPIKG